MNLFNTTTFKNQNNKKSSKTHVKFRIPALLRQNKILLQLSEPAIRVATALISYTRIRDYQDGWLIVWPSNHELLDQIGGSLTQLHQGLRDLKRLRLIIADPGKRDGKRDAYGKIDWACGVDLTPLVSRIKELKGTGRDQERINLQSREKRERIKSIYKQITRLKHSISTENNAVVQETIDQSRIIFNKIICGKVRDLSILSKALENLTKIFKRAKEFLDSIGQKVTTGCGKPYLLGAENPTCTNTKEFISNNVIVPVQRDEYTVVKNPPDPLPPNKPNIQVPSLDEHLEKYSIDPSLILLIIQCLPDYLPELPAEGPKSFAQLAIGISRLARKLAIPETIWQQARRQLDDRALVCVITIVFNKRGIINNVPGYIIAMLRKHKLGQLNLGPTIHKLARKARMQLGDLSERVAKGGGLSRNMSVREQVGDSNWANSPSVFELS